MIVSLSLLLSHYLAMCEYNILYTSVLFTVRADVRQGGILSPVLFAVYVGELIFRLKSANIGCKLLENYYGCLLYADDIILLTHILILILY